MKICKIDGCDRKLSCKGYCTMHYQRVKASGEPGPAQTKNSLKEKILVCKTDNCNNITIRAKGLCSACYSKQYRSPNQCSINGCNNSLYGNSYCQMHWQRTRKKNGDPGPVEPLKNSAGEGGFDANGYRLITFNGVRVLEHRHIMEQHLGRRLFLKENIHHINGDRSDNRIKNLELWNTSQPAGQRIEDKIQWAKKFLKKYGKL